MQLYSKEGLLLLVQIDHLSGEMIGNAITCLYEAGAKNVQVLSSITKKNRPGYMVFIDTPADKVEQIEAVIVKECGSSGWHRLSTCHRHTNVSILRKEIKIIGKSATYLFLAEGKVIDDCRKETRPEYESCIKLRQLLLEKEGICVPVKQLHSQLTQLFCEDKNEWRIEEVFTDGR